MPHWMLNWNLRENDKTFTEFAHTNKMSALNELLFAFESVCQIHGKVNFISLRQGFV